MFITRRMLAAAPLAVALSFAAATLNTPAAQAQTKWPERTVRIVVAFPAGGAVDAVGRLLAARLQQQTGQPFIIENKAGAGGNVGADFVAKSAGDGYTMLLSPNGMAIAPAIYKKLNYNADDDFIRATMLMTTSTMVVATPKFPAKNLQEMIALAKANPGKFNYGSTGVGNSLHLTMELLLRRAGIQVQMVPFRGDAPMWQALTRGDVELGITPSSAARAQVEGGAVRAIGISTPERSPGMPNVPTIAEQGMPGFDSRGWMGFFLPKGTPREIVVKLADESRKAVQADDIKARFAQMELSSTGSTPEEFEKVYRADRALFEKIIKDANIPLQ